MDLISIRDLNQKEIESILKHVDETKTTKGKGKILATAFFEPSTRTRLSFQSAALRLGMNYIDFSPEVSSLRKGENFTDTLRMIDGYADIVVVRHAKEGAARLAAGVSEAAVINGGDGGNQHPTQTLVDLYTIKKLKKKIAGLDIALVGDLKHARTMHSLVYALAMFGARLRLIAPSGLELDKALVNEVKNKYDASVETRPQMDLRGMDVLYTCRIQEERFADPYEAKRVKEQFKITLETLQGAKNDLVILNPLPRLGEVDRTLDTTSHAKYFEQAHYGVPVRMGIIDYLLQK